MVLFKLVRDILAFFLPYFLNLSDNFLFGHNGWYTYNDIILYFKTHFDMILKKV